MASTGDAFSGEHLVAVGSLRLLINLLGCLAFAAYAVLTLLSYVQAPALWRAEDAPRIIAFFDDLAVRFPSLALYRSFATSTDVVISWWIPLLFASAAVLGLVLLLLRLVPFAFHGDGRDDPMPM